MDSNGWEPVRAYVRRLRREGHTDEGIREIMLDDDWQQDQLDAVWEGLDDRSGRADQSGRVQGTGPQVASALVALAALVGFCVAIWGYWGSSRLHWAVGDYALAGGALVVVLALPAYCALQQCRERLVSAALRGGLIGSVVTGIGGASVVMVIGGDCWLVSNLQTGGFDTLFVRFHVALLLLLLYFGGYGAVVGAHLGVAIATDALPPATRRTGAMWGVVCLLIAAGIVAVLLAPNAMADATGEGSRMFGEEGVVIDVVLWAITAMGLMAAAGALLGGAVAALRD